MGSIDLAFAKEQSLHNENKLVQEIIEMGEPGKKGLKTYVTLFNSIAEANDIKCDILSNYSLVYAYGFKSDLENTKLLYNSLLNYMVRQADNYVRMNNKKFFGKKPANITQRISFQMGFSLRIGKRLKKTREKTFKEAINLGNDKRKTEIVLANKEIVLKSFYEEHSKAKGTLNIQKNMQINKNAFFAGDHSGKNVSLGRDKEISNRRQLNR